jgi:hypothetical protein
MLAPGKMMNVMAVVSSFTQTVRNMRVCGLQILKMGLGYISTRMDHRKSWCTWMERNSEIEIINEINIYIFQYKWRLA